MSGPESAEALPYGAAEQLADALAVSSQVERLADDVLADVKLNCRQHWEMLGVSQALRARLFFLAVTSLARLRLSAPTAAILRCLMELQFTAEAIERSGLPQRIDRYRPAAAA